MSASVVGTDAGPTAASRVLVAGALVALGSGAPGYFLAAGWPDAVEAACGAGATGGLLAGTVAAAAASGLAVAALRRKMLASEPAFLGAWVGGTLLKLVVLGAAAVWPAALAGERVGRICGAGAALVLGSLCEIPAVWRAARGGAR